MAATNKKNCCINLYLKLSHKLILTLEKELEEHNSFICTFINKLNTLSSYLHANNNDDKIYNFTSFEENKIMNELMNKLMLSKHFTIYYKNDIIYCTFDEDYYINFNFEALDNCDLYICIYQPKHNNILNNIKNKNSNYYYSELSEIRENKIIFLALIKFDGDIFEFATDEFKDDRDIVVAAIKSSSNNFNVLEHVSERLKDDDEIVYHSMDCSYHNLEFASTRLQKSVDFAYRLNYKFNEDK
jgi:hypothetical protein